MLLLVVALGFVVLLLGLVLLAAFFLRPQRVSLKAAALKVLSIDFEMECPPAPQHRKDAA